MRLSMMLIGVCLLAACEPDLAVPNLNNPSAGGEPTRSSVIANAHAGISAARGMATAPVRTFGIWGRESYDLRPQEPRPYTDNLIGPRDMLSFGSGSNFGAAYSTMVDVRVALEAVDAVVNMTDAEKEGVRGWLKTVTAYAYFQLAVTYRDYGAPLAPPVDASGELEAIATQEQLYDRAIALFDEAATHLGAAGGEFAFSLPVGFEGYDTPATFLEVNRALKARTLKYMGRWADVLTALGGSFIDPNGDMQDGAWFSYDPQSGGGNPFTATPTDFLHPRIVDDAQLQPGGAIDQRALDKARAITPTTIFEIAVTEAPAMYPELTSPFPWIKNEELLLIRAEANLALNGAAAALADVNTVRQQSGGLAPLATAPSDEAMLDEILYNKLYSLLWEGGFAFRDAAQYGRLADLPRALPEHRIFTHVNWPSNECTARGMTSGPCGSHEGI